MTEIRTTPLRRNLSGIYLMYRFEGEERHSPTCFEDCSEEKQDQWMESLEPEALKNLAKQLGRTLRHIGDALDITA